MNGFSNTLLVVILVLLVGFGVWYFSNQDTPEQEGFELNIGAQGE